MKTTLPTLKKSPYFEKPAGPVLLIIMDGVGLGKNNDSNAVFLSRTPFLDTLSTQPSYCELKAHGKAVGMPSDEDMGNSEVGHNALGAGRIFDQGAALVQQSIKNNAIYEGEIWKNVISHVSDNKSTLHFIGLLSDGNVHSHIDHLLSMIKKAYDEKVQCIRIHILLDGRDVDGKSAPKFINKLESFIASLPAHPDYKIASGGGRMITTMDRYNADWSIVKRGWDTHVLGLGLPFPSALTAIETLYEDNPTLNDQFLPPFVITDKNEKPIGTIEDGDAVIFTNFRGDRAIEISKAFEDKEFTYFDRVRTPSVFFAGMMEYDGDLHIPKNYLVSPPTIQSPIGEYMCGSKLKSFAISETQKYGHVTYFWNGNRSGYIDLSLETYVEIPSDRLPFEQKPEMKAREITKKTIELLQTNAPDFGRVNLPNGDMVGHTGVMQAVIKAVETTDQCVKEMVNAVNKLQGITVILADHGNADEMYTERNGIKIPKTSHTLNPVPFCIIDSRKDKGYTLNKKIANPGLANIASTLCNLLGYEAPKAYEPSLIKPIE